ncbi:uncharacterized protein LOC129753221 [Uranotaenia lowii]|uniref:uncharacterized protein LOC129753221 n=1 Tax=Uranotaenia lowii TaxID=190385 RepID=UPI00247A8176|nr:uncharacterized protein LOC129753221 [Uranotaenia lowii]
MSAIHWVVELFFLAAVERFAGSRTATNNHRPCRFLVECDGETGRLWMRCSDGTGKDDFDDHSSVGWSVRLGAIGAILQRIDSLSIYDQRLIQTMTWAVNLSTFDRRFAQNLCCAAYQPVEIRPEVDT